MKLSGFIELLAIIFIAILIFGSCKSTGTGFSSKRYKSLAEQNLHLKSELDQLKNQQKNQISGQEAMVNLTDIVKMELPGFELDEIFIEVKNGKIYVSMSDKLLFRSGSASVEEKGKLAVKRLAEVMERYPQVEILVEGHTDAMPVKGGQYRDNWELSAARAIAITKILVDGKIDPARITASGKAEFKPVAPNNTPEGRAKNRRTDIILIPVQTEFN